MREERPACDGLERVGLGRRVPLELPAARTDVPRRAHLERVQDPAPVHARVALRPGRGRDMARVGRVQACEGERLLLRPSGAVLVRAAVGAGGHFVDSRLR